MSIITGIHSKITKNPLQNQIHLGADIVRTSNSYPPHELVKHTCTDKQNSGSNCGE